MGRDKKLLPSGWRLLKPYHYGIHSSVSSSALLFHYMVCAANEITAISRCAGRHGATMLRCSTTQPPSTASNPFFVHPLCSTRSLPLVRRLPLEDSGARTKAENLLAPQPCLDSRPSYRMLVNYGYYSEHDERCRGSDASWAPDAHFDSEYANYRTDIQRETRTCRWFRVATSSFGKGNRPFQRFCREIDARWGYSGHLSFDILRYHLKFRLFTPARARILLTRTTLVGTKF